MDRYFNSVDFAFMAIYVLGLILISLILWKRASANIQEYFLGGNKIPWWAMGISGFASQLDMSGTMIVVSLIFLFGLRGMYIEIRGALILLMAFAMVFMGKWNRRSGCMTVAEWMEYRFGHGLAGQSARVIQAVSILLLTAGTLAMFVKGAGLFLSLFFPVSPFVAGLVLVIIATFYTVVSGFYGVVFTDIFQSVFVIIATIIIAFFAFNQFPDSSSLATAAQEVTGNTEWLSTSIPIHLDVSKSYSIFEKFALAIFFYTILICFIGMSRSGGRPMYFGARSERECGTLSFVWITASAFRWPLMAGFVILGIVFVQKNLPDSVSVSQTTELIKVNIPEVQEHTWGQVTSQIIFSPENYSPELIDSIKGSLGENWGRKLRMINYHGTVNTEQILPAAILYMLPAGLRGIVFIALIAAAMSTFDSYVNMTAGYFVRDIYQRVIRPKASHKELIKVSYLACIGIVILGVILGFYAKSINDIWDWLMVGLSGGIALPGLLRWYWWRFNGFGFAGGVLAGLIAAILQRALFPGQPPWIRFPLVLSISLLGSIIGTYCSKPTEKEVLHNFYLTTKPFGFWGPLKKTISPSLRIEFEREHRNDLIALLFAVPWQFFLYWTPMQFMFKAYKNFWISIVCLILCSIGLYVFWYKNLPKNNNCTKSLV